MTALSVGLAVLAVLLWWRPPGARQVARRLMSRAPEVRRMRPRGPAWFSAGSVVAIVIAGGLGGARSAVLTAALVIVVATSASVVIHHVGSQRALRARMDVAEACAALAAQLRVGRIPAEAVSATADDYPVLASSAAALRIGGDPAGMWTKYASVPGHAGLGDLSRAWRVTARTGAPLAPSLEQVADGLASDAAVRRLVASELSAPRATSKIMAVLPLFGMAIGYAIGGDPLKFLLDSPYGWGCLLGGIGLAGLGVLWVEALARRAAEG